MIAIGAPRFLPSSDPDCLVVFETAHPQPRDQDLVVEVEACSINPVDTKIRASLGTEALDQPRIMGWDAAGIVRELGPDAKGFAIGDEVFYAGDLTRAGCNSQFHAVDSRLVAHKPKNLSFADSASLPLVAITAWELLFERMKISPEKSHVGERILVINGAGGVGSLLIPLARMAGLEVISTASRPETTAWCKERGACHVIDHHQALTPQLEALGISSIPWIANLYTPDPYWDETARLIEPMGTLGLIVEPAGDLPLGDPLKAKCATITWEFMAARAKFDRPDLHHQGKILSRIASLCEEGAITPPTTRNLGHLSAATLREAHTAMESRAAHGKWVMEKVLPT